MKRNIIVHLIKNFIGIANGGRNRRENSSQHATNRGTRSGGFVGTKGPANFWILGKLQFVTLQFNKLKSWNITVLLQNHDREALIRESQDAWRTGKHVDRKFHGRKAQLIL